ncbi:MAG: OsmC family protein [Rubrivivax sp.]
MSANTIGEALDALSARFTAMPEAARVKTPAAVSTLVSGLVFETRGPNGELIRTDVPAPMGGTGTGPNPGWLMRAALASCAATGIASRAARLGVKLKALEVSVQGEADLRGALGLDPSVSAAFTGQVMKVKIASDDATPQVLEEIVRWAEEHSPVGRTLCSGNNYAVEIDVLPNEAA